jgi:hypothetical protein
MISAAALKRTSHMPCMSWSSHRRTNESRCALRQPAIGFIALHAQARLGFSVRLLISKCLFRRPSSSCASHRAITVPNVLRRFTVLKTNAFWAPDTPKSPAHTENVLGGLCYTSRHMPRSEAFSMGDSVVRGIKPRSFCHDSTSDMEHPWCGDVKIAVEATITLCYPKLPGGVLSQLSRAAMGAKVMPYATSDTPRLRQLST